MKKLILLFYALGMAMSSWAYSFVSGNVYYTITSASAPYTVEVSNSGKTKSYSDVTITIPSTATNSNTGITYTVTAIGESAFQSCSSITSVTLPSTITNIKDNAFNSCSGLTSFTIPSGVDSISYSAFNYCKKLTTLTVDSANTRYKAVSNILYNKNLTKLVLYLPYLPGTSFSIPSTVDTISNFAFYNSALTSVTIPSSVKIIGSYAFGYCYSLTSLALPSSVSSIGLGAFTSCSKIKTITVDTANTHFTAVDSVLFSKDLKTLIFYPALKTVTSYTIPSQVDSIADYAFWNCSNLTSITIPNSVTSLGLGVFEDCTKLTSITIPSSITSLPYATFYYCKKLASVTLSAYITSIGDVAFYDCSALKNFYVYSETPASLTTSNIFNGVTTALCSLFVPKNSVSAYQASAWNKFNIIGMETSAITNTGISTLKVSVSNGNAVITGAEAGTALNVYNLQGIAIYSGKTSGENQNIPLPAHGVYIVQLGDKSVKVIY